MNPLKHIFTPRTRRAPLGAPSIPYSPFPIPNSLQSSDNPPKNPPTLGHLLSAPFSAFSGPKNKTANLRLSNANPLSADQPRSAVPNSAFLKPLFAPFAPLCGHLRSLSNFKFQVSGFKFQVSPSLLFIILYSLFIIPASASDTVATLCSSSLKYETRYAAIETLPATITQTELHTLRDMLGKPIRPMHLHQERLFFNDLIEELFTHDGFHDQLTPMLINVSNDSKRAIPVREYAIQFIHQAYPHLTDTKPARNALLYHIEHSSGVLRATSLRSLTRHSKTEPKIPVKKIYVTCERILANPNAGPSELTVALQSCAALNFKKLLPQIRAQLNAPHVGVRATTYYTLGQIGEAKDLPILQTAANQGGLFAKAAKPAHQTLSKQLGIEKEKTGEKL